MELLTTQLKYLRSADSFFSLKRFAPAAKKEIILAKKKGAKRVFSYHHFPDSFHHQIESVFQKYELLEEFYKPIKSSLNSFQEIGLTGTHGKTSIATLLQKGFLLGNRKWGSMGTLGFVFPGREEGIDFGLTTCDLIDKYWAKAYSIEQNLNLEGLIYEVSSHALVQKRHYASCYDVTLVTDITFDEHRDYHKTPYDYLKAKAKLFEEYESKVRLIHQGNPLIGTLQYLPNLQILPRTPVLQAQSLKEAFHLPHLDFVRKIFSLYAYKPPIAEDRWLQKMSVQGRVEPYMWSKERQVLIDYAHSPKALEYTLSLIKRFYLHKPLWVIFGCGGNRDRVKRPQMLDVVARYADVVLITEDHNRDESFEQILSDILSNQQKTLHNKIIIINKRENAINYAYKNSHEGSLIFIAGKGHETYESLRFNRQNNNDVKQVISYATDHMC